jgi:hypothetical protein
VAKSTLYACYQPAQTYKRRKNIEQTNNHLVIIDIIAEKNYRLINLYRVFNTFSSINPFDKFKNQLKCIDASNCKNILVVGDFNLKEEKRYSNKYQCWKYFTELNELFDSMSLIQMVNFPTWHRLKNGNIRSSTKDHVYCYDRTLMHNLHSVTPYIGDHEIVIFSISEKIAIPDPSWRRNWKNYNPVTLNERLAEVYWQIEADSVQDW